MQTPNVEFDSYYIKIIDTNVYFFTNGETAQDLGSGYWISANFFAFDRTLYSGDWWVAYFSNDNTLKTGTGTFSTTPTETDILNTVSYTTTWSGNLKYNISIFAYSSLSKYYLKIEGTSLYIKSGSNWDIITTGTGYWITNNTFVYGSTSSGLWKLFYFYNNYYYLYTSVYFKISIPTEEDVIKELYPYDVFTWSGNLQSSTPYYEYPLVKKYYSISITLKSNGLNIFNGVFTTTNSTVTSFYETINNVTDYSNNILVPTSYSRYYIFTHETDTFTYNGVDISNMSYFTNLGMGTNIYNLYYSSNNGYIYTTNVTYPVTFTFNRYLIPTTGTTLITGLTPNTGYYFRLTPLNQALNNGIDISGSSTIIYFHTAP